MGGIGGDSLRRDIAKVVLGFLRESTDIDYRALYGGQILFSDGNTATVQPDDSRFGQTLSDCRVRRGDGVTASLVSDSGVRCLFGWEGGDPSKRYCLTAFDGTGSVQNLDVRANGQVDIGGNSINVSATTTANVTGSAVNLGDAVGGQTLANQTMVTATATVIGAVGVYAAAVALLLPVTAPAATALATAIATYVGAVATYVTTKTKAT